MPLDLSMTSSVWTEPVANVKDTLAVALGPLAVMVQVPAGMAQPHLVDRKSEFLILVTLLPRKAPAGEAGDKN
jgi:hypothetical protein